MGEQDEHLYGGLEGMASTGATIANRKTNIYSVFQKKKTSRGRDLSSMPPRLQ
jgi:hypothetical protein